MIESIDLFPTLVELAKLPALPACEGTDQPPTTLCLQGTSFAGEFFAPAPAAAGLGGAAELKQYAFSQWPYPDPRLREGYTVRSAAGYRYTTYVPYNLTTFSGDWTGPVGDEELYDYNTDRWETTNFAYNGSYAGIVAELRQVLLKQYAGTP